MHGTVVMLMALSGLGCHYKHADVVYAPSCYSGVADACYSSCYSSSVIQPACYSSCYSASCYSSCYSEACYSSSCYSSCYSGRKHGFFGKHFGKLGGLFKKHHRTAYVADSCYSSCYSSSCYTETYASCYSGCYSSGYAPAVFGTEAPIYGTPIPATTAPATAVPAGATPATTAPATTSPAGADLYRGGQPAVNGDTPPPAPGPAGANNAVQGAANAASNALQNAADAASNTLQGAADAVAPAAPVENVQP